MNCRIGISDHESIEIFERVHQKFTQAGCDERQASRIALYCTYRASGTFNDQQAWEAVNELLPRRKQV